MRNHPFLVLVTLTLIFLSPSLAAEFHVTDSAGFQNALDTARNNGQDDTIFLPRGLSAGTYELKVINGVGSDTVNSDVD